MNRNKNQIHLLQILQSDLIEVQKQFIKWRLTIGQLSKSHDLKLSQLTQIITIKLDSIHFHACQFCLKIENQLKEVHSKINNLQNIHTVSLSSHQKSNWIQQQQQQYSIINKKINHLEQNLKRTQDNERKLIASINEIMNKYQISEHPSLIKNDEYLKSQIQCSKVQQPAKFQLLRRNTCMNVQSLPVQNPIQRLEFMSRQKESKRQLLQINRTENVAFVQYNNPKTPYIRTLSRQVSPKMSQNTIQNQINFPSYNLMRINQRDEYLTNVKSASCLEQSQHRINFLMQNLIK